MSGGVGNSIETTISTIDVLIAIPILILIINQSINQIKSVQIIQSNPINQSIIQPINRSINLSHPLHRHPEGWAGQVPLMIWGSPPFWETSWNGLSRLPLGI